MRSDACRLRCCICRRKPMTQAFTTSRCATTGSGSARPTATEFYAKHPFLYRRRFLHPQSVSSDSSAWNRHPAAGPPGVLMAGPSRLCFRLQKVAQADTVQHLGANAIENGEADIGAVLRRINVNAKRPLSEWRVDDVHDRLGNRAGVRVRRHDSRKRLLDLLAKAAIWARFILRRAHGIGRST